MTNRIISTCSNWILRVVIYLCLSSIVFAQTDECLSYIYEVNPKRDLIAVWQNPHLLIYDTYFEYLYSIDWNTDKNKQVELEYLFWSEDGARITLATTNLVDYTLLVSICNLDNTCIQMHDISHNLSIDVYGSLLSRPEPINNHNTTLQIVDIETNTVLYETVWRTIQRTQFSRIICCFTWETIYMYMTHSMTGKLH
jgi:hypothetical protein